MENPNNGENTDNQQNHNDIDSDLDFNFEDPIPDLQPSWSLYDYSGTIGRDVRALETTQLQIQEKITELKAIADAAPHRSPMQLNAVKSCIHVHDMLASTLVQLRQKERASGFQLSEMMKENHLVISNIGMIDSLRQLYDLGWKKTVMIPANVNPNVQEQLLEAIQSMQDVTCWVVSFPITEDNIVTK